MCCFKSSIHRKMIFRFCWLKISSVMALKMFGDINWSKCCGKLTIANDIVTISKIPHPQSFFLYTNESVCIHQTKCQPNLYWQRRWISQHTHTHKHTEKKIFGKNQTMLDKVVYRKWDFQLKIMIHLNGMSLWFYRFRTMARKKKHLH